MNERMMEQVDGVMWRPLASHSIGGDYENEVRKCISTYFYCTVPKLGKNSIFKVN